MHPSHPPPQPLLTARKTGMENWGASAATATATWSMDCTVRAMRDCTDRASRLISASAAALARVTAVACGTTVRAARVHTNQPPTPPSHGRTCTSRHSRTTSTHPSTATVPPISMAIAAGGALLHWAQHDQPVVR
jgi:hypothetical protein